MTGRQPEYQNLQRYKKQKDVTAQNVLTVFVTTFLIMLVFFIGAAKRMTPNVDVAIGEDSATDAKESGLGVKGFIDNRLKSIKSEDAGDIAKKMEDKVKTTFDEDDEDEYFSKDLEEKVKIPTRKVKQEVVTLKMDNGQSEQPAKEVVKPISIPTPTPQQAQAPTYTPTLKVLVGNYASIEQAKVAKTVLDESGLGVTSFIKNIQGSYVLQVGSFSSEAKAQSLAKDLVNHGFVARVVKN